MVTCPTGIATKGHPPPKASCEMTVVGFLTKQKNEDPGHHYHIKQPIHIRFMGFEHPCY